MKFKSQYEENTILEIPMPTINRFMPPLWHTAGFVFGWKYLKKNLDVILKKDKPLFYLIHPADFLDESDMNNKYNLALERMKKIDYKKKIYHLQNMLEHIVSSGYKGVKLLEIAKHYGVNDN